ncbi:IS5/IS1182 family transposase, partial [Vibrio sp. 10N.222.46.A3]
MPKQTYKLTNWPEYNQSLMNRGRIDIWINEEGSVANI